MPYGVDDLFVAGDTHQRIYDNLVSLFQVSTEVVGRSRKLKLNYRTTAEMLAWSMSLLQDEPNDDMGGEIESRAGCRSEVHGARPKSQGFPTQHAELAHPASAVRA
ncbi:hypothetical protein [Microbispora sp. NBC_01389]|uniref:hypothetical protein n=1 Tax=Microbispora sp. NBC_01389 TaxID=2903584 RepID=UPI003255C38F